MIDSSHSPIVDFDIALRRLANNPYLLHELIGFFREDVPELIEKIEAGLATDDAAVVRRASHSIKSMAASFEGLRVVHLAFAIEQRAAEGDLEAVPAFLPKLRTAIAELELEFDRYGTPTER
jgi:HPt (histidine-containing phosphotransfer) domain-containing protein